ncbi:hypothetical protein CALVIDRAFT_603524 [Calocera viscosa TUFC12733]|uniref:Protein kinase domain-containing protein n=1 Tax=Calocera viscosa (strain TUFC12733) TaxID=1330018 RepID=A0A167FLH9_CALVF|nr:hypothetical protein CALVIDRAFT_603524 [Calocera viscosa TUFC12733]
MSSSERMNGPTHSPLCSITTCPCSDGHAELAPFPRDIAAWRNLPTTGGHRAWCKHLRDSLAENGLFLFGSIDDELGVCEPVTHIPSDGAKLAQLQTSRAHPATTADGVWKFLKIVQIEPAKETAMAPTWFFSSSARNVIAYFWSSLFPVNRKVACSNDELALLKLLIQHREKVEQHVLLPERFLVIPVGDLRITVAVFPWLKDLMITIDRRTELETLGIAMSITECIRCLHEDELNISHGDIHLNNFLSQDARGSKLILITDFEFGAFGGAHCPFYLDRQSTTDRNPSLRAPEVTVSSYDPRKSDIYELAQNVMRPLSNNLNGETIVGRRFAALQTRMVDPKPGLRPDVSEALKELNDIYDQLKDKGSSMTDSV